MSGGFSAAAGTQHRGVTIHITDKTRYCLFLPRPQVAIYERTAARHTHHQRSVALQRNHLGRPCTATVCVTRILTFTTLFPNSLHQRHGIFVEQRLRHLLHAHPDLQARVVAPIPWFPFSNRRFGQYSVFAQVPDAEQRFGVCGSHPRFAALPLFGWRIHPHTMFAATRGTLSRIQADGFDFDVIDSHFVYPDGVAAVRLGQLFNKPV